jgi:hypothetical protein
MLLLWLLLLLLLLAAVAAAAASAAVAAVAAAAADTVVAAAAAVDAAAAGTVSSYCRMSISLSFSLLFQTDFGPCHGWACWAYERDNGLLGKTPTNNRSPEFTLLRAWVAKQHTAASVAAQVHQLVHSVEPADIKMEDQVLVRLYRRLTAVSSSDPHEGCGVGIMSRIDQQHLLRPFGTLEGIYGALGLETSLHCRLRAHVATRPLLHSTRRALDAFLATRYGHAFPSSAVTARVSDDRTYNVFGTLDYFGEVIRAGDAQPVLPLAMATFVFHHALDASPAPSHTIWPTYHV